MNILPKFDFTDIRKRKWRSVDVSTTRMIARRCSRGVDFRDANKNDVIESIAKPHGFKSDADKFIHMMDEAADIVTKLKDEYSGKIVKALDELDEEWNETVNLPKLKTIPVSQLSHLYMVGKGEKEHSKVIHNGYVKQWVGIGWVTEHKATLADKATIPTAK